MSSRTARTSVGVVLAALALALVLSPVSASAQEGPRKGCWPARSLPECRTYLFTEAFAGAYRRLTPSRHEDHIEFQAGVEAGWMLNLSERASVGVGLAASNVAISLRPRYRRWLDPRTAVDLSLGAAWMPGRIEVAELNATIIRSELIGITGGLHYDFGRGDASWFMGLRTGWIGGVSAVGAAAAAAIILALTYETS